MKNFLFSKANREALIFLFFFALAGVFWLMIRLNDTFEEEVRLVVRYTNVKKNAVLTTGETDTLRVTISDKGFNILSYAYGQQRRALDIDFARFAKSDGTGVVGSADVKAMVTAGLPASTKIISIKPERLLFSYNNGESKRVPVLFRGNVTAQEMYFVSERKIFPDSVVVYATRHKLDSIKAVYTEEHSYSGVRDTLLVSTRLAAIQGAKMVPDKVDVRFVADVLTEASIDNIPIEGINMPEDRVLRTFPAKTTVHFVTGMKRFQSLSRADFRIVADYAELSRNPSQKCNIYLLSKPDGIQNVRLDVTQVDYLIEGQ